MTSARNSLCWESLCRKNWISSLRRNSIKRYAADDATVENDAQDLGGPQRVQTRTTIKNGAAASGFFRDLSSVNTARDYDKFGVGWRLRIAEVLDGKVCMVISTLTTLIAMFGIDTLEVTTASDTSFTALYGLLLFSLVFFTLDCFLRCFGHARCFIPSDSRGI